MADIHILHVVITIIQSYTYTETNSSSLKITGRWNSFWGPVNAQSVLLLVSGYALKLWSFDVGNPRHKRSSSGWLLNQPMRKIFVKMGSSSPKLEMKIKNIWNHHLVLDLLVWCLEKVPKIWSQKWCGERWLFSSHGIGSANKVITTKSFRIPERLTSREFFGFQILPSNIEESECNQARKSWNRFPCHPWGWHISLHLVDSYGECR